MDQLEEVMSEAPSNTNMLMGKFLQGSGRFWLSLTAQQGIHTGTSVVKGEATERIRKMWQVYISEDSSNGKQMLNVCRKRNSTL